ncbi:glycosyltransferase [Vibrio renipiscarius]|uniref:Glycosyl transferase n=1 Tax=Vibrio renipiscarius TaxID=1461322 RepID=A0A0C2KBK2_9VIBR|nr:glycosyltransferase [Vibrio renipiscarius]KII79403.1 glycosyl transferase [Vibrio renipiscarius]KII80969.1 glycosyl transferase [Vibrio renipiscarius]
MTFDNEANEKTAPTKPSKVQLIIHVVQHLTPGGIESMVLEMLRCRHAQQRVLIIALEGEREDSIKQWPKLQDFEQHIIFLNKPRQFHLATIQKLRRLFLLIKPDVIHTHHIGPLLYAGIAAKSSQQAQHIHTEHDAWHFDTPKHAWLQRFLLMLTQPRLVADADEVSMNLKRVFDYRDITVIKNGIDCRRFHSGNQKQARQQLDLPLGAMLIGSAGRLEKVKGHDVMIRALALLPRTFNLAIAGIGSQEKDLKQLSKDLGVENRIIWLGLVDDMPTFYQSLDVFCLPSRHEGFPLATLEAQACGTATIASDVGAVKETICPNTGGLFNAENAQAIADQIYSILAQAKPQNPRSFVVKNNDIHHMLHAYQRLSLGNT